MLSHFNPVWLFETIWTVAHQAPLSMGFPRQEYWSGLPFTPPGDLRDPEIEPKSLVSNTGGYNWMGLERLKVIVIFLKFINTYYCYLFSFFTWFFFYWRIIALQFCVAFCHTSTWISHRYIYISSLLNSPLTPHSIPSPLDCYKALGWAPCVTEQIPICHLLFL